MQYTHSYSSPLGGITLAANDYGLTGLWFVGQKYYPDTLKGNHEEKSLPIFRQTAEWLDIYFSGKEPDFMPPLSLNGSPFQMEVWEILREIPYGKIMTYGEIAARIARQRGIAASVAGQQGTAAGIAVRRGIAGMSAQAVGGAVGHNPISILVPCHRVVGANGSLTGYAGGVDRKAELLKLEKADMIFLRRNPDVSE